MVTSGATMDICVVVADNNAAAEALKKTEFSARTEEKFVPCMTMVSIPAKALPAGLILVIVGAGLYDALGSYKLLASFFEQLFRNRSPRAARRRNEVVLAMGRIGIPAS
jgi:hypothetical protein